MPLMIDRLNVYYSQSASKFVDALATRQGGKVRELSKLLGNEAEAASY